LELNLPQYFWQKLCLPESVERFVRSIDRMQEWRRRWPRRKRLVAVSDDWFTVEGLEILAQLFGLWKEAVKTSFDPKRSDLDELAIALVLPFVGRLACWVPGGNPTQVKNGGMCIFEGWAEDHKRYLDVLKVHLSKLKSLVGRSENRVFYGDARTYQFPPNRFEAMVTSPPYPNRTDYRSLFAPENFFLKWLFEEKLLRMEISEDPIIGSNFVAGRRRREPTTVAALQFLTSIEGLPRGKNAVYHDDVYYLPYFRNYFCDLEDAYKNVSKALKPTFTGYVIVVNNTHRNTIVPVASVIMEIWERLGFKAAVHSSSESFHYGTKNPRARGIRGRHTQFIIEIKR